MILCECVCVCVGDTVLCECVLCVSVFYVCLCG